MLSQASKTSKYLNLCPWSRELSNTFSFFELSWKNCCGVLLFELLSRLLPLPLSFASIEVSFLDLGLLNAGLGGAPLDIDRGFDFVLDLDREFTRTPERLLFLRRASSVSSKQYSRFAVAELIEILLFVELKGFFFSFANRISES